MRQQPLLSPSRRVDSAFSAFEKDLLAEGGPRISTMRNHPVAMLAYPASREYRVRARISTLADELRRDGWAVLRLSLQRLFWTRLEAVEPGYVDELAAIERELADEGPTRALDYLGEALRPELDALADDCTQALADFAASLRPDQPALCVIGHAGPLYPFFRYSALLKRMGGRTHGVPVVLLYPGDRKGDTGLSFLGRLPPDRDYRPRIYA